MSIFGENAIGLFFCPSRGAVLALMLDASTGSAILKASVRFCRCNVVVGGGGRKGDQSYKDKLAKKEARMRAKVLPPRTPC